MRVLLQCSQCSDLHHTCYRVQVMGALQQQMGLHHTSDSVHVMAVLQQQMDLHRTCYSIHVMAVLQQQMAMQETNKEAGVLVKAEERAKGRVDRRLYKTYLAAWGPFFSIPLLMVFLATSERGLQVSQCFSKRIVIEIMLCIEHCSSHLLAPNAGLSTQHSSQFVSVEKVWRKFECLLGSTAFARQLQCIHIDPCCPDSAA